jgi:DNA-binding NarL/FixJ family response regulator
MDVMRVLLFDGVEALRTRFTEALAEISGVNVSACAPHEGRVLCEIHEVQPEVVILDMQMPDGSALRLIRDIKAGLHPPVVIALSSISSLKYRAMSHKVGADFFFDKGSGMDALLHAVREIQNELER